MMRAARMLLLVAVVGCSKSSGDETPPPTAGSAASASGAPPPTVAASSAASASAGVTRSWRGTYKSEAATMTVVPDWKKVHWSDTQSTAGIGEGTLTLSVDGATGKVLGALEGPLGPASIEGMVTEGKLAATIRRKDPNDQGFTGTLLGVVAGDHAEGTMNVAVGLASTLRTATFTLAPGTPSGGIP